LISNMSETLRLATFNVHFWSDAKSVDNADRVVSLAKENKIDIICLQEAYEDEEIAEKVADETGMRHKCHRKMYGVWILSKFPLELYTQ